MRHLAIAVATLLLLTAAPVSVSAGDCSHAISIQRDHDSDYWDFDMDNGTIIMTHHRDRYEEIVEITEEYELYVNGERIELNEYQQELVTEFYDLSVEMVDHAKKIGWEGAKIGISGARLGVSAIGRLVKMAFTSYDSDDFERDMEREAERLEARAELLEEKAEQIEDMADELEDIAYELSREVPELEELDWF